MNAEAHKHLSFLAVRLLRVLQGRDYVHRLIRYNTPAMHTRNYTIISLLAILLFANAACAQIVGFGPTTKNVTLKGYLSVDKLRVGDKFRLAVQATVAEGAHIGGSDKDAAYPTRLKITPVKGITFKEPVYPKSERKSFPIAPDEVVPVYEGTFTIFVDGKVDAKTKPGPVTISASLDSQACKGEQCFPPETSKLTLKTEIVAKNAKVKPVNKEIFGATTSQGGGELGDKLADTPLALRLLMLYGLGLLLAFTPCVYPMVPVTVGYFSTQGESRTGKVVLLAAVYVLGLALTYSILGAVAASAGGVFGAAMQTPPVLIGIALILVALALSMFGLYELQPPAFIQSKASGKSGVLGALIMGLIFGIVCAPCVGPVVLGLMTYVAKLGSPLMGFLMFFVLSIGLGTPLFALAAFSAKLPLPGMWMVAVKKVAGFLLLGAAAYFVAPILPDSIGRYLLPTVVFVAGVYLGFFEKSIRASRIGSGLGKATSVAAVVFAIALVAPKSGAHSGLDWQPYNPAGLAAATKSGRPVMVDFTAKWCAACKELEKGPFSDQTVIDAAAKFDRLRVDGTNTSDPAVKAAVKKFSVKGFPTVIFIDSSGSETSRVVGYVNTAEILKHIKGVK